MSPRRQSLFPAPEQAQDAFESFWQAYPRRVAKKDARKAWQALRPNAETVQKILDALVWQAHQPAWEKDGGSFIPYPATWLRAERWDDEPFAPMPDLAPATRRLQQSTVDFLKVVHAGSGPVRSSLQPTGRRVPGHEE